MRINVHSHIFNFRSVLTAETLGILLNRLGAEGWPPFLVNAAEKLLTKAIKGDYVDEQGLITQLVDALNADKSFKKWLDELGEDIPGDVQVLAHGNLDGLLVGAARELLHKLDNFLSRQDDIKKKNIQDFVAFLLLGIRHSILDVAEKLIEGSGEDAVVVTLMMDITDGKGKDEGLYVRQMQETSLAALMYPGRILPFVAVNTRRVSHWDHMVKALETKGFVGVKLYPSLGYSVQSPEMDKVFTYCEANEIPVLLHCNQGGFYESKASIRFADPNEWIPVLAQHPQLRVCFAHFGGDENIVLPQIPPDSWTDRIIKLMGQYPHVYTDIAYHTDCMDGGDKQTNYFRNLSALLSKAPTKDRILFGSDFHLVRQRLREDNLWRYFESNFKNNEWALLTRINPARFVGLTGGSGSGLINLGDGTPNPDGGPRRNIQNHLSWLAVHNTEIGREPTPWALELIEKRIAQGLKWFPNEFGTRWTENNDAHYYAFIWLNSALLQSMTVNDDFYRLGRRLVRDLRDWPPESRPPAERSGTIRAMAGNFYKFMVTPRDKGAGAVLEAGVTQASAKSTLAGLFSNGNLQLHEFGTVVDALFHFDSEDAKT